MSDNSLIEVIPESIDNAAKNLTDPVTKGIGGTLGDIWTLVFGGISQAAAKKKIRYAYALKQYEEQLKRSIDAIPAEKKVEPNIQVTAQALEASKYCVSSEVLRDMFVKLVSGTMNSDIEPSIHPSFPEILKQMDEKDAKLLIILKSSPALPIMSLGINSKNGGYQPIYKNLLLPYNGLSTIETTISASALERAGLVELSTATAFTNPVPYRPFESLKEYDEVKNKSLLLSSSMHIEKGICQLTNLGKQFTHICA